MKLEWMGAYREIIGVFYRSANGYSQICKNEMFGDPIKFSPYEVQIMEHADQHRNMKCMPTASASVRPPTRNM